MTTWQTEKENIAEQNGFSADLERKGTGETAVFFVYVYNANDDLVRKLPLGQVDLSVTDLDEVLERAVNVFSQFAG